MSFLSNIGIAFPENKYSQEQLLSYMLSCYRFEPKEAQKLSLMYGRSGIQHRYSVLKDFGLNQNADEGFFELGKEVPISKRMATYFEHAPNLAATASKRAIQEQHITHLITVSCTGMAAPGLDLMLLQALNLSPNTPRTSVNFMGCYALFHAFKMADAICNSTEDSRVLVVSVELCTLHFNQQKSTDIMAANLLFGDGAAACIISSKPPAQAYFKFSNFYSKVIYKGRADMAWHIHEDGFLMTLSAYIPQLIEEGLGTIIQDALQHLSCDFNDIQHWAIHPGGRKIVDGISNILQANSVQTETPLRHSYEVLKEVGNLSSTTLLHVLNKILQLPDYNPQQKVFAAGFGPGLTVETCVFNA